MRATGSQQPELRAVLRRYNVELAWLVFSLANFAAMIALPSWETIPFHFVWISLTLVYGFRVWPTPATLGVLGVVMAATGSSILLDAFEGKQLWGELFEVPLMAAMFLAMVWHARRRMEALAIVERRAEERRSLLERQERFIQDASHELRTPVTIARGHLELVRREVGGPSQELDVALEELVRIDRIVDHLLLLATADQPDFLSIEEIDLEAFLEDVFMRWCEVAPRAWRLAAPVAGTLSADPERLRAALDALLENAVKYTAPDAAIELCSRAGERGEIVIEVRDEGSGVPSAALERIFDRFARADAARTRSTGGVGLGLAIVDAIAKGHGGRCTVTTPGTGSAFALRLPGFSPVAGPPAAAPAPVTLFAGPSAPRRVGP
jgi:signal transduction histidine kinase